MSTSTNTLYALGFDLSIKQEDLASTDFFKDLKDSLLKRVQDEHPENEVEIWHVIPFPKYTLPSGEIIMEIQAYFNII